jgi:hypothetical protein
MPTAPPSLIPFPLSSSPGATSQEGAGRLVNVYGEPLGDPQKPTGPAPQVWRRSPGLSVLANTSETATYRGGLIVNNLSFEVWSNVYTVTASGVATLLGQLPGTKKVSIARDQAALPDVVVVDPDNGAYVVQAGGVPQSPALYNGGGNLPQPNSICFQDGYFFYTIASGQCFASPINSIGAINALTFITAQAKSDVTLLRGIAYNGWLWLFTTGHCEIWQDVANPAPQFPYGRLLVLEKGLVQGSAIAGWETGFSELLWVAQDFGVYWATPGSTQPIKVSPPDLDRLIETQVRAGNTLEASCYSFAGQKFWCLSSPAWSWEFNVTRQKWNERSSLNLSLGEQGRWRSTGGHPAFGKWLMGDEQSGNLIWLDSTNYTECGVPQLTRLESGPVRDFPNEIRIARADFDFVFGVGEVVGTLMSAVVGTSAGNNGAVRLQALSTSGMNTNDIVNVANVGGTTEANGTWPISVIDATHVDLIGSSYQNAYTSGGLLVDVTAPANQVLPSVAISLSKDGGNTWGNPLIRQLGQQDKSRRPRASVKSMGLSGPMGCRWRLDISDPVYVGFLGGMQSSDPKEIGA